MGVLQMIGAALLVVGWIFALTGSIGVLRMPDFYSRLHPAGMTDSFAQGLIILGLCMYALQDLIPAAGEPAPDGMAVWGVVDLVLKMVLLIALIYLTSPTATHAISKAARHDQFTKIDVHGDPGDARLADLVIPGDTTAPLEERHHDALDVDEPAVVADANEEKA